MKLDFDLVASIYEASAIPEKWPDVLAGVAKSCGAKGSIFICAERGFDRTVASAGFQDLVSEFAGSKWASENSRIGSLMNVLPHPGFVSDAMLHSREALKEMPIFKEFFIPRGIGAGAATALYGASNDGMIMKIEGFQDHKAANHAIARLNALRPHLARASLVSWQLSMQRTQAGLDALGMIGNPAAALGNRGQLIAANKLFTNLMDEVFVDAQIRLRAKVRSSDKGLSDAIQELLDGRGGKSIAMTNPKTEKTSALHLVPVEGEAHDIFQNATGLAILARSESPNLPPTDLLESLFDLSPKEAAIGRKVALSKSIKLIAKEQGVSTETVRWHLKNVMQKTGVQKQADLMRLIMDQSSPGRN